MGKIHVPHRVVTRDEDGRIVGDIERENYVLAREIFEQLVPGRGQTVTLQHGARIIMQKPVANGQI